MAIEIIKCEECNEDSMFRDDEGPDGRPVWVCTTCARYWEDRDGKPSGEGEAMGNARLSIRWPSP